MILQALQQRWKIIIMRHDLHYQYQKQQPHSFLRKNTYIMVQLIWIEPEGNIQYRLYIYQNVHSLHDIIPHVGPNNIIESTVGINNTTSPDTTFNPHSITLIDVDSFIYECEK